MQKKKIMQLNQITYKKVLTPNIKEFRVYSPQIARNRKPGQFIILRIDEYGERIPLTIADSDPVEGTVTIIFQEVGKTTEHLGTLEPGDVILDFAGPLGNPTHIENVGVVVCIGGGCGTAPVYPIAKGYKEAGNTVIGIIGARDKGMLIMEHRMSKVCDTLYPCTDDGSYGFHGFVSQKLQELLDDGQKIDLCIAIGPVPMMRATANLTKNYNLPTMVSLNTIMVDGTGMCGACRVTVGGKTRFVCVDGPEFDGHQVDWEEMTVRMNAYLPQERLALERFHSRSVFKGSDTVEACDYGR